MNRLIKAVLPLLAAFIVFAFPAFAFAESNQLNISKGTENGKTVISCETEIKSLYIRFAKEPGEWTLENEAGKSFKGGANGFMHEYVDVAQALGSGASKLYMSFPNGVKPEKIYAFDDTDVPDWVQIWQPPCEKADFMLISTHADDEQLFFAGILPYYAQVRGYEVQVVYATDHYSQISRHHERLDGLWAVGIRHYPVSMGLVDAYSESYEGAIANLKAKGVSEQDVIDLQTKMIKRFEPQVIATHDVNGEYGHGQHKMVNGTLQKACANAENDFPYLKKIYFHLYDQNQVVLNFLDEPYAELGGLTPFQVTQVGFGFHESQHWTWFKRWLLGNNGEITKASQINTYSPMQYGMFYGNAAADTAKDDFFENVMSYEEQRIEAERIAEEQRLEEERLEAERQAALEAEAAYRHKMNMIKAAAAAGAVAVIALVLLLRGSSKKKKYKGRH